uniref:Uncharacterized protein n=1 Tax=Rhizophora mucronata TaxID=61149 RepID=A0A2P2PU22_RHIMU
MQVTGTLVFLQIDNDDFDPTNFSSTLIIVLYTSSYMP